MVRTAAVGHEGQLIAYLGAASIPGQDRFKTTDGVPVNSPVPQNLDGEDCEGCGAEGSVRLQTVDVAEPATKMITKAASLTRR